MNQTILLKTRKNYEGLLMSLLKKNILDTCEGDYIGLWGIVWEAEAIFGTEDLDRTKKLVFDTIEELLKDKKIKAGYIEERAQFTPVMYPIEKILDKLEIEFEAGDKPIFGGTLWFTRV